MASAKEKVEGLLEILKEGVEHFTYDPNIYKALLEMKAFMPQYSFNNIVVANAQLPHASFLASFKKWNELGRSIRKGEKAIQIFAPRFGKEKKEEKVDGKTVVIEQTKLIGFITVPVFDISQVKKREGAPDLPIERIKLELQGDSDEAKDIIQWVESICTIPIEYGNAGAANGYYNLVTDSIMVSDQLSLNHRAKTLVHEYCHSLVHKFGGEDEKATKREKEVVAEGVAFIVCSFFALDTSDYSFQYIKGWGKDNGESLVEFGSKIFMISSQIISSLEKAREKEIKKTETTLKVS